MKMYDWYCKTACSHSVKKIQWKPITQDELFRHRLNQQDSPNAMHVIKTLIQSFVNSKFSATVNPTDDRNSNNLKGHSHED